MTSRIAHLKHVFENSDSEGKAECDKNHPRSDDSNVRQLRKWKSSETLQNNDIDTNGNCHHFMSKNSDNRCNVDDKSKSDKTNLLAARKAYFLNATVSPVVKREHRSSKVSATLTLNRDSFFDSFSSFGGGCVAYRCCPFRALQLPCFAPSPFPIILHSRRDRKRLCAFLPLPWLSLLHFLNPPMSRHPPRPLRQPREQQQQQHQQHQV